MSADTDGTSSDREGPTARISAINNTGTTLKFFIVCLDLAIAFLLQQSAIVGTILYIIVPTY